MSAVPAELPFVDAHTTSIAARADRIWTALNDTVERALSSPAAGGFARALGCVPPSGFGVVSQKLERELVLEGRHRFSTYRLTFRLDGREQPVELTAETHASFPGLAGAVYRMMVIGTGGHVFAVRGLLSAVQRRAEGDD